MVCKDRFKKLDAGKAKTCRNLTNFEQQAF
jgi:hypothetical protein